MRAQVHRKTASKGPGHAIHKPSPSPDKHRAKKQMARGKQPAQGETSNKLGRNPEGRYNMSQQVAHVNQVVDSRDNPRSDWDGLVL